jgi:membrane fusion protein, multidrug efflux system
MSMPLRITKEEWPILNERDEAMMGIARVVRGSGLGAILLLGAWGCSGGEAQEGTGEGSEPGRVVSVEVMELAVEVFTDRVQVVGTVEANRDVTVAAEESGTIRQLLVEKGSPIRSGQAIARIDDRVLRPQAEQAASEAALARETYERQRRLWEEDGVGSEMAYLRAKYAAETADAAARAMQERLERTIVRAPFDGVLDDRFVEVGSLVAPGSPVARVIDVSRVKIAGGVPERFAGQVVRGAEVEVLPDGLRGAPFVGRIDFVGASVEPGSRTFPIEVLVPSPGAGLKPGMIANVRVARQTLESALVVPQEAVLRVEDGYLVYVVGARSGQLVAEPRLVALGPSQANRVVVDAGLEPGDRVVVVGQNRLAPGDRLQIVATRDGGPI